MNQTTSFHLAASQRMFRPTTNGLLRIGFWVVLCLIALSSVCRAAVVEKRVWVWMGGAVPLTATNNGETGVYGTLGVPATTNMPGVRGSALSWTDSNGNLWLFGGQTLSPAGSSNGYLNDLWKYSPATGEWVWISGSDPVASTALPIGVYGTLGHDLAANVPGARSGLVGWTDSSGNLWLFGGYGYDAAGTLGYLNDLWKFNPITNKWTWMGGSSTVTGSDSGVAGVYGTHGTAAATTQPGSRSGMVSWTDSNGNFWLFGGNGFDSAGTRGDLNDLWMYSPATNQWTWINGSNLANQSGSYGNLGVSSSANVPSGRAAAGGWIDSTDNLWLFGGGGPGSVGMNDLWKYSTSTGQWMWISGSITPGETGVYGIMGDASTTNVPGGRVCANTWIDSNGNLWLLGGAGYDSTGTKGFLDDLWQFNPSTGQWMWMNGSSTANQPVVYGTLATPSSTSTPGGRYCPSSWLDGNGNFWLFGGWYQSSSGNNSYPLNDLWEAGAPTSAPTFSPAAGSYNSTQTVTIAGVSSDAAIHFTTDGATPTASSSLYTGPITVSSTETLEAIAVVPGYLNSAPSTATYTLNQTTAATPQITPASGTYTSMQSVALLDSTPGATIYYTSDGTTPTANSSRYSGLISIAATTTLKAIAIAPNYGNSSVLTATYTLLLQPTATPTFSPATGTYTTAQSVMISDTTPSATIYYTTNGSAPTSASAIYSSPITVSMNETIQAAAIASGYSPSSTASATYTIAQATLATPTFSIAAGTYSTTQTVAISDTATNATICYTTDGSSPTTASTIYTGPISVTSSETLKAVAFKSGYTQSEVATVAYTITQSATATPTFSPVSGSYSAAQFVSIIDTATNATIYYTTDGTTPTSLSAVYSGPISVASSETIEAIAVASNNTRSGVATATYTIAQSVVATPTFSVASGVFTAPQTITIADTTTATTICYTIDGSTPTSASAIYTGPITVSATETVKAVAYKSGYIQSAVASATYVFPITPTITWPTPAAISYGTPLSATQLDATASVAGTFTYSSAVGVLLPAGSNTLSVAFTPRNQTEYTTATASVTLIVNVPSNPAPAISSISPAFVNAGSSDFTLTVNGSGFDSGSTVYWGSTALVTQFVSAKQLTAMVPAACVASTGVFAILVQSSTLGGGVSTALQFEVDSNAAGTILPPTISSTTVAVTAGSTAVYSVTIPSTITTLTVSCLNMPVGASCTYSATTHQIIITTSPNTPKGIYQITVVFAETSTIPANAVGLLPILLLPFAFAGIRRKTGFTALLCLILLTTTFFASGCSDSITQSAYSTTSSLVSLSIQ